MILMINNSVNSTKSTGKELLLLLSVISHYLVILFFHNSDQIGFSYFLNPPSLYHLSISLSHVNNKLFAGISTLSTKRN